MVLVKYNFYKWEITGNELSVSKSYFFPPHCRGERFYD